MLSETDTLNRLPLVTIYLPTKDRLPLLSRAIKSVLSQDYKNIELVIVDDGSKDGTKSYLKDMSKSDQRIVSLFNHRAIGACASRNKAIGQASGKFITGLDDDDYLHPSHISSFVELWSNKKRGVALLYPNATRIIQGGNSVTFRRRGFVYGPSLLKGNFIGNQSFTEIETLRDIGGFDVDLPAWQDIELWYRILRNGSKAQNTGKFTYTFDESHGYTRISTNNFNKIVDSFNLFAKKHKLSEIESRILYMQVERYLDQLPKLNTVVKSFFYAPTINDSVHNARLLYQVIKSKLINTTKTS